MARNVQSLKPELPVLWLEPTREEQPMRNGMVSVSKRLPQNPLTRYVEPESDHLGAPAASRRLVIEWMREVAAKN